MSRAFILLLDSFGIGSSQDAHLYGDEGANTLGHIADYCAEGKADHDGIRKGLLQLPNLNRLGLSTACLASSGNPVKGAEQLLDIQAAFGYAVEQSRGKDTPSGHWEIAGVPVLFDWGYFSAEYPSFPKKLLDALIEQAQLPGILGNKHASGTTIIDELGAEHISTGKPIVYTSADSVFQIAAHEESFGLQKLYELCEIARKLVDDYNIGRVIARPFAGVPGKFYRTGNRRDLATPPPQPTLLDKLKQQNHQVISVGKVADIFAHQGITQTIKANGNTALFDATIEVAKSASENSLIFTNFVDFDMVYGHRRDVIGYAKALETFDQQLPEFEKLLRPDDIAIITADHGCDPTWKGSDHTREHIPVLVFGKKIKPGFIGRRDTFSDIGQSLAHFFGIKPLSNGISFL